MTRTTEEQMAEARLEELAYVALQRRQAHALRVVCDLATRETQRREASYNPGESGAAVLYRAISIAEEMAKSLEADAVAR